MNHSRSDRTELARPVRRTGASIILIGGILIALAYWVLPVATVPLIGSVSAPTLTDQSSSITSFSLLGLVPLTVVLIIAAGGWLLARPVGGASSIAAIVALVCAGVTALAYLVPLAKVDDALDSAGADSLGIETTNLTGVGFWVALIGVVVTALGAITELARRRAAGRGTTHHAS
jgi:hypothetical protein